MSVLESIIPSATTGLTEEGDGGGLMSRRSIQNGMLKGRRPQQSQETHLTSSADHILTMRGHNDDQPGDARPIKASLTMRGRSSQP